jgi:hypothetical protein
MHGSARHYWGPLTHFRPDLPTNSWLRIVRSAVACLTAREEHDPAQYGR